MIYIIGVGSHSDVIYSILMETYPLHNIYFLSYPSSIKDLNKEYYKGGVDEIVFNKDDGFIIGIGDNKIRKKIAQEFSNLNYVNAIHPKAYIHSSVKMGRGNVVCPGVTVQPFTIIGYHNIINTNASVDHHNIINSFTHIAPNCALCGNVNLYNCCFIGAGSTIVPKVTLKAHSFYKANSLIKDTTSPIVMYEPYIAKYRKSAFEALDSGWISSIGKYKKLATDKMKTTLNAKYVLLTNNGTTACHCLFLALKYKYPQINKIYVPNNVYVAAWNCALMEYQKEELEVLDISEDTWNMKMDEDMLKSLDINSAILIVHNVGNIVDINKIREIRPDIILLEDNCEGFLGEYRISNKKVYTGTSNETLCSSISFFGNKTITTGEGGAVITADEDVFKYLEKVCNQGCTDKRYIHDVLGYNYRMSNICAALLYDQLCDIQHILGLKKIIFDNYDTLFKDLLQKGRIKLPVLSDNTVRANWIYSIRIIGTNYDNFQKFMTGKGIDVRPMFYPIHAHQHLKEIKVRNKENLQISAIINGECCMLPSYPQLSYNEQEYIVESITEFCNME